MAAFAAQSSKWLFHWLILTDIIFSYCFIIKCPTQKYSCSLCSLLVIFICPTQPQFLILSMPLPLSVFLLLCVFFCPCSPISFDYFPFFTTPLLHFTLQQLIKIYTILYSTTCPKIFSPLLPKDIFLWHFVFCCCCTEK